MHTNFTVSLAKLLNELSLETLYLPCAAEEIFIKSTEINRPGIQLAGFYGYFDNSRIQIIGKTEEGYLEQLSLEEQEARYATFLSQKPPAIIIARSLEVPDFVIKLAKRYEVPVLRSSDSTSEVAAALIAFLVGGKGDSLVLSLIYCMSRGCSPGV